VTPIGPAVVNPGERTEALTRALLAAARGSA
jgi:hypothetical protein